jgi:hypothetical protein
MPCGIKVWGGEILGAVKEERKNVFVDFIIAFGGFGRKEIF